MKTLAKLVYKTCTTYLPTAFPAHYYGMPNGKIYLVFSRFYKLAFGQTGLEFVFAEHKDYFFDYERETIIPSSENETNSPIYSEHIDNPDSKFNIFSISRKLRSYADAQNFLNAVANKMHGEASA